MILASLVWIANNSLLTLDRAISFLSIHQQSSIMNASLLESSQILRVIPTGRPFLSITSRANSHGRLLSLWSQFRDSSLVDQVHHSSTEGVVSSFATFDCFKASRLAISDFLWHSLDALSQCPDLCRDVLRISITLPALELPLDYEVLSLLMSDIGALNVVLANVLSLAANLEVFRWDIPRLDGMVVFPERAIFTLRTISTLRHVTLSGINTPHITGLSPIGMIGLPLLERFAISDSGDTSFWYAYWLAFAPNIKQLEIQDELDHLSPQAWVTKSFDALSCIQGIECLALQCSPISFSRYAACLGAITVSLFLIVTPKAMLIYMTGKGLVAIPLIGLN